MRTLCSVLLLCLAALPLGCSGSGRSSRAFPLSPAPINHIVLVKLSDPADAPRLISECNNWPREGAGITNAWAGTPVQTGHPKVDGDYDVAFVVAMRTREDYDTYQCSPWHTGMLSRWMPRCTSLRIFDFAPPSR